VTVYVNGEATSTRPLREEEIPLMRVKDDVHRVFLLLAGPPCRGGDDITCDVPPLGVDQVWVRFPCLNWKREVFYGNMRIFPDFG